MYHGPGPVISFIVFSEAILTAEAEVDYAYPKFGFVQGDTIRWLEINLVSSASQRR